MTVKDFFRSLPRLLPQTFRGRRYLINSLNWLLLGREETVDTIGKVYFPFLPNHWPFYFELYEQELAELVKDCLCLGDTFVDVGANVGYFSALALNQIGPTGHVFAFEPEEMHFKRLLKLTSLNPKFNLHVFNSAVNDMVGTATLFISNHAGWHSLNNQFQSDTRLGTQKVITTSLDVFCINHGLCDYGAIKLLKIDVESAEDMVINGAKQLISERWAQVIFIEVTPDNFPAIQYAFSETAYCLYRYDSKFKQWQIFSNTSIDYSMNLVAKIEDE